MRGFFFFKDTSNIKEVLVGDDLTLIQELKHAPNQELYDYSRPHKYIYEGEAITCAPFFGYVKRGNDYAGIPMLVNGIVDMAGLLNISEGVCIIEVELGDEALDGRFEGFNEIDKDKFNKLYYEDISCCLAVTIATIPSSYVTAIYMVQPIETNILQVSKVFNGELGLATCNTALYTNGCGSLYRPTDDGGYEVCNDLIKEAVRNHGQQYAYGDMTMGIMRNVCTGAAIEDVLQKLDDKDVKGAAYNKKLGSLLPDDMGSDSENN